MTNPDEPGNDEVVENDDERTAATAFLPTTEDDAAKNTSAVENKEEVPVNFKDFSLCKRLKVDPPYRRRFIHTVWLFWTIIGLGWIVGQMGPTFPDIRSIVQQDLDTASWLFTLFSVGYLVGSFVGGMLYDRFNKLLLIAFSTLTMAVTSGLLPWCKWFPLMLFVRFVSGMGSGGLDTGANADLLAIWDEEGRPYMQALHFCFGLGGIISALVAEPFLAKEECLEVQYNETGLSLGSSSADFSNNSVPMTTSALNISNSTTCEKVYGKTYIHYLYLISFFIIVSTSVPFFVMYFKGLCKKKPRIMAADKSNISRPDKLPFKLKVVFLILLFTFLMIYCAVEDTFSGFLATFCISHLKWTKGTSSFATSTFWTSFSVGRFSGIFLIRIFRPVQLLCAFCILLVTSFIGLSVASVTYTIELVWVFIALAGFSMSILFPCIFTWAEESILMVTGMVSSIFIIGASMGLMLNPLLLGFLMDNFMPLWFVFLLLGESCVCLLLFVIVYVLVRKFVCFDKTPRSIDMEIVVQKQEHEHLSENKLE